MKISASLTRFTILVMAVIFCLTLAAFGATTVEVEVSAPEKVSVSAKAQADLKTASKALITSEFRTDYGKSVKVMAETNIMEEIADGYRCESIVTFLYKNTYTAVVSRVEFEYVKGQTKTLSVEQNYVPESERNLKIQKGPEPGTLKTSKDKGEMETLSGPEPVAPDQEAVRSSAYYTGVEETKVGIKTAWYNLARGFANTPCTEFPSAVRATRDYIAGYMHYRTGRAYYALGSGSSRTNVTNVLRWGSNLRYWSNIGHGWPGGLVEAGGNIYASYLAQPGSWSPHPWRGLVWTIVTLNSCRVFNNPLKTAVMSNYTKAYMGGLTNLRVGRSEWVTAWFWYNGLIRHMKIQNAYDDARNNHGWRPFGTFGIAGYTNYYFY